MFNVFVTFMTSWQDLAFDVLVVCFSFLLQCIYNFPFNRACYTNVVDAAFHGWNPATRRQPALAANDFTIVVVVVVVVVEYYIYLYILLLDRLAVTPHFFLGNNTCCTNYAYKRPGIRIASRTSCCTPPVPGGRRVLAKRYVFHYFSAGRPEMIHFSNGF